MKKKNVPGAQDVSCLEPHPLPCCPAATAVSLSIQRVVLVWRLFLVVNGRVEVAFLFISSSFLVMEVAVVMKWHLCQLFSEFPDALYDEV